MNTDEQAYHSSPESLMPVYLFTSLDPIWYAKGPRPLDYSPSGDVTDSAGLIFSHCALRTRIEQEMV